MTGTCSALQTWAVAVTSSAGCAGMCRNFSHSVAGGATHLTHAQMCFDPTSCHWRTYGHLRSCSEPYLGLHACGKPPADFEEVA